jgi:6-phosphogluconolactonase
MKARSALFVLLFSVGCSAPAMDLDQPGRDNSNQGSRDGGGSGNDRDGGAKPGTGSDGGDPGPDPIDPTPETDGGAPDSGGPAPAGPLYAYASGYGANISIFTVDPTTGALTLKASPSATVASPSFLAVNRASTNLYAVSEVAVGRVAAYTIDAKTGGITYLNDVSSKGNGPAHVWVDATSKWVLTANYGDGFVAVLPVQAGGRLGEATDSQLVGTNAHMIVADPTNKFVYVPCKGADYIAQFTFDAVAGKLVPNTAVPKVKTKAGAGPRHIAFHPNGKLAYLINESNSTMTGYALDGTTGVLTEIETLSTLPAGGFAGVNTGAEVWVHPSGKFVYGSNRGHDSIVVFAIDPVTGKMTLKGHTKTTGTMPRDFTLDPKGTFLYAANQGSGTIVPFKIDPAQGTLGAPGASVGVTQATFVGLVHLPAN